MEVVKLIDQGTKLEELRAEYLNKLAVHRDRNIIAMYSGFLQINDERYRLTGIDDDDKNGLMACIHNMKRSKGLDLLLHTPGGGVAATESIVNYLRDMFDDYTVIVPQMAMSGGTMIACSSNEIIMGKHSSLGPVDPIVMGYNAHALIEEFNIARGDIEADRNLAGLWGPILDKYKPTLILEAMRGIEWAKRSVTNWLITGMLSQVSNSQRKKRAKKIVHKLTDTLETLAHERQISANEAKDIGLNVKMLESDQIMQDIVLTIHHCYMITFANKDLIKIIENQHGTAFVQSQPNNS